MKRNNNQQNKKVEAKKSVYNNLAFDDSDDDQVEEVVNATNNLNVAKQQPQQPTVTTTTTTAAATGSAQTTLTNEADPTPRPFSGGFISTMDIPDYYPIGKLIKDNDFSERAQVTFNTLCIIKVAEYDIIKEIIEKYKPFVKLSNTVYEISKSSKITGKAFQEFQDDIKKTKVKTLVIKTILTIKAKNPEDCSDIAKWIEKQVANFVPYNYPTKVSTFVVSNSENFTFKSMIPSFDSINVPYQLFEKDAKDVKQITCTLVQCEQEKSSTATTTTNNNNKISVCNDEESSKDTIINSLISPLMEANQSLVGSGNDKKIKCSLKFGNSIFYQLSSTAFLPSFTKDQLNSMETYKDFRSKQDNLIKESDFNAIAKFIKDNESTTYKVKETDASIYRVFIGNYKVRLVPSTTTAQDNNNNSLTIKGISQLDERVVTLDTVYPGSGNQQSNSKVGCRISISKSKNFDKDSIPKNFSSFLEQTTKDKNANSLVFPTDFYKTKSFSKSQTTYINNTTGNIISLIKISEEKRDEIFYSIKISNPSIKLTNKPSEDQFKQALISIYSEYQSLVNKL
ncbi:hypothetical protein DDB_G0274305 [Dictyostelium discoideum AX4]|uniref:Uncharacterized protein n=1 Tax=Dictyostelium discoideum TaxID=44689 RepID=Q86J04_DICDI|nr:hypothetical protein DDB_G0274305 [Dictyostelium discoideum AX4]EAL70045.1 hypothetical protein DDB_G0274305 [Dictyostelium discoideum AX4]|eukprot:XP_643959.1 hypothetical protein DDB_G0274305 [Dictyostelium discoideum AX4]